LFFLGLKENFNKGWAETPAVHQHFESIPFNTKGNNYKSPCYIPQFCKIWIASLSPLTFQWKIWSNLEPHARARADTSFCKCYIYHQGNALLLDVHILNMHNIALYSFISLQNGCEPCSLSNRCDISMQAFPDLQRSVFQLHIVGHYDDSTNTIYLQKDCNNNMRCVGVVSCIQFMHSG